MCNNWQQMFTKNTHIHMHNGTQRINIILFENVFALRTRYTSHTGRKRSYYFWNIWFCESKKMCIKIIHRKKIRMLYTHGIFKVYSGSHCVALYMIFTIQRKSEITNKRTFDLKVALYPCAKRLPFTLLCVPEHVLEKAVWNA